jgi:hypothetical protein
MQSYNRRLYTSEALWKNLVYVLVFCLFAWWQMRDVFVDDEPDTDISDEE